MAAGVYHFTAAEFGLRMLRAGDYRSVLVEATATEPAIVHAPLIIVCTCTYWRNAWKYQDRTYAISAGTTARCSPTFYLSELPWACPPSWFAVLWIAQ